MDDLIRRSDAIELIAKKLEWELETDMNDKVAEWLNEIPAVEPKHGEWKHLKGDEWLCSNCGYVVWTEGSWEHPLERGKDYCEHCGAQMKGADDEHDK